MRRNSVKISFTGTFSLPHKDLEDKLLDHGFAVINFSGATSILLVGEKTASVKKIAKAKEMGIWVLEDPDWDIIINTLGMCEESGYIPFRDRYEEFPRFEVEPFQAASVFFDYMSIMQDGGEWFPDGEGKEDYSSLIGKNPKGRKNLESYLFEDLGIDIPEEEKEIFFKMFFRALCLEIFLSEVEMLLEDEEDSFFPCVDCMWDEVRVARSDFWEKFCHNFEFDDSEERQEFSRQKVVKNLIARYKSDEEKVH